MRSVTVAAVVFGPLLAAGCMARVGYTATVSNEGYEPEMAYAAPGVQVIVDYDEPIFYADSFYWRFYGGGWYRSHHHNDGWVYATPPPAVRGIDRPQRYVHYRPAGWAGHRDRGGQQPVVRGQPGRVEPPPRSPVYQQPPARGAQPQWQPPPRAAEPRWQPRAVEPQQQPRPAQPQQQPRPAPSGPRDRERHDDQGRGEHRGDGEHHRDGEHRGDGEHGHH